MTVTAQRTRMPAKSPENTNKTFVFVIKYDSGLSGFKRLRESNMLADISVMKSQTSQKFLQ